MVVAKSDDTYLHALLMLFEVDLTSPLPGGQVSCSELSSFMLPHAIHMCM